MGGYCVVSRKINERVVIGEDVEILVAFLSDDKVELAIRAPKEKKIRRRETHLEEMQNSEFESKFREQSKKNHDNAR